MLCLRAIIMLGQPMKKCVACLVMLILGLFIGVYIGRKLAVRDERRAFDVNIGAAKRVMVLALPKVWAGYYAPSNRIPLPLTLDLSTNALQSLTFWHEFAQLYSYTLDPYETLREGHGIELDAVRLVERNDRIHGGRLAMEAAIMRQAGRSLEDIRQWVIDHSQGTEPDTNLLTNLIRSYKK